MSIEAAAHRHVEGLAMERRGDEQGAFAVFLEAAEDGYPPAQRRLGEIYDSGNSAVVRNYLSFSPACNLARLPSSYNRVCRLWE